MSIAQKGVLFLIIKTWSHHTVLQSFPRYLLEDSRALELTRCLPGRRMARSGPPVIQSPALERLSPSVTRGIFIHQPRLKCQKLLEKLLPLWGLPLIVWPFSGE